MHPLLFLIPAAMGGQFCDQKLCEPGPILIRPNGGPDVIDLLGAPDAQGVLEEPDGDVLPVRLIGLEQDGVHMATLLVRDDTQPVDSATISEDLWRALDDGLLLEGSLTSGGVIAAEASLVDASTRTHTRASLHGTIEEVSGELSLDATLIVEVGTIGNGSTTNILGTWEGVSSW